MRKLLFTPLVALLCSVTAWAVDVSSLAELQSAIETENASITLTANITLETGTLNLNGATINCGGYCLEVTTENGNHTLQNGAFISGTSDPNGVLKLNGSGASVSLENISINNSNSTGIAIYTNVTLNIDASSSIISKTQDININAASAIVTIHNRGSINGFGINLNAGTASTYESTLYNYAGATFKQRKTYKQILSIINEGSVTFANGSLISGTLNLTNNNTGTVSLAGNKTHTGQFVFAGNKNITISGATYNNPITNNGTLTIGGGTVKGTITNNGTLSITGGIFDGATITNNNSATVSGGTFQTTATTFNGTENTLITGGTFSITPSGTKGYIEPTALTECRFTDENGYGDLSLADGYILREDGLIVVDVPAIVVAEIKHQNGNTDQKASVADAFRDAVTGDTIILMENDTTLSSIWIGTENVSDPSRTLVFDLNGHTLTSASDVVQTFTLMHGKLYVINSVPGQGGIENTSTGTAGKVIFVHGTYEKLNNSRTASVNDLFTYLYIGEGVLLNAKEDNGSAIIVDDLRNTSAGNNYNTKLADCPKNYGLANSVRIDVKGNLMAQKYGVKINGYVAYPVSSYTRPWDTYDVLESDTTYSPYIHVFSSSTISVPENINEAVAVAPNGYGRWLIEGKCLGTSGVYIKSGEVILNNAIIESTNTEEATLIPGQSSGINTNGHALLVESNRSYSGQIKLSINGDTKLTTAAPSGAALMEYVTTDESSLVREITINGGYFTGEYALAISNTTVESGAVKVYGATLTDEDHVLSNINPILAANVHTTVVPKSNGPTTVIVSAGSTSPIEITNFGTSADPQEDEIVDIAEQQDRPDANWTGTNPGEVSEGTTVALGELQIISGTSENGGQQLTVGENATLQVERLIMNEYATIVVEAGGKLIVDGTQGINAPEESNIILETSETDQATFLFNPEVTSNRHPMATVKLTTKARQTAANDYIYERFTIPTMDGNATTYGAENLGSVVTYDGGEFKQALYKWNGSDWEFMPSFKAMNPFQGYQLTNNSANGEVVYTFEGNLVGNTDNDYNFVESGFGFFGNSYSADINIGKLFDSFEGSDMQKTIWIYDYITDGFKTITPESYGSVKYGTRKNPQGVITDIRSMQAFLMNKATAGTTTVDYGSAIWGNPKYGLVGGGSGAPAKRVAADDRDYITIYVANETSEDEVTFIRSNEYSNAFDNGADASKWMNNGINLYATTEEGDLAAVATNDIINMTIAFRSGNETEYTLGFDNLSGEEYAIRDILTGAVVNMEEGATYSFTQEANTTIPARFQIIGAHKMPTGMETVEEGTAVQQKVIMNGVLYILRDNKWYNAQGQIVK